MTGKTFLRYTFLVALLLTAIFGVLGAVKVESFKVMDGEITARTQPRRDLNDKLCALVRVGLPLEGALFQGNVIDQRFEVNEYLVYITDGCKQLRIKIPNQETLDVFFKDYIDEPITSGTTYLLTLSGVQTPSGSAVADAGGNYLVIDVSPKGIENLSIKIDGQTQEVNQGVASVFVDYGSHEYQVEARGYETLSGRANVHRGERTVETVTLLSTLADIVIKSDTPGAIIYVNDQRRGTGSWSGQLAPGTYLVEAKLDGHRPYSERVTLGARENRKVTLPALQPIYGAIRIDYSPFDASVKIDGKASGTSPSVINDILIGEHTVRIEKDGCEPAEAKVNITEGKIAVLSGSLNELPKDELTLLRYRAEAGDAEAQFQLGFNYHFGEGVATDPYEAVKWWSMAAEQGNVNAQYNLGVCYDNGEGVSKDPYEAVKWFRKAAEQGDAAAQFNIGCCYLFGEGVSKDLSEAVKWWQVAAEQGYADAQFNLGLSYDNGDGVTKNLQEAIKWYRKAAEQGYSRAQFNLGNCYENGDGVSKNLQEAIKWYNKAAAQGDEDAKESLRKLGVQ